MGDKRTLQQTKECTCNLWMIAPRKIEFFNVSASRTELRCSKCNGLIGVWDRQPPTIKILPFKRDWSEEECLAMR